MKSRRPPLPTRNASEPKKKEGKKRTQRRNRVSWPMPTANHHERCLVAPSPHRYLLLPESTVLARAINNEEEEPIMAGLSARRRRRTNDEGQGF
ncbi:hypothetical protein VIGAN_07200200 [Vigna angularis var. angularis]|uniref:Uncharacterized protein n=1 Tax=Vigna angularis var. angularis TaxID=157739 RepID=A0A0S3SJR9_PHAAN|nr:hypothetical protein VIGAN_07200200 [Vigna angularis var. angularis]